MKNLLVSDHTREMYFSQNGTPWPEYHCSGRSTFIAVETIYTAMKNQGASIEIPNDHNSGGHKGKLHILQIIKEMLVCLDLQGFSINRKSFTITYKIFEES